MRRLVCSIPCFRRLSSSSSASSLVSRGVDVKQSQAHVKDELSLASEALFQLKQRGLKADAVTYSKVISLAVEQRQLDTAVKLLKEALALGRTIPQAIDSVFEEMFQQKR